MTHKNYKPDQLRLLDKKYLWHPFTQMRDWEEENPLIIEKGEGNYLYDIDGKKYLDGISSLWVTVHGHRKKEIDEAIKDQVDRVSHSTLLGLSNVPATLLAEKLVNITPAGLNKVFYSDSGSTAAEIAIKIAFQYWQQKKGSPEEETAWKKKKSFLTFKNAYHGDTIGSVSVGGIDLFHEIYHPLLFDSLKADFDSVFSILKEKSSEIAAVVLEPLMQGAAGMLMQPPGFLKKLRRACDDANVLLIFDEVATGFGRTGKLFACDHEKVSPDMICIAKGITGGYLPLAATLTSDEIYQAFHADYKELKTFFHGHTYTGNPLACAAALANLEIFEKEKTIEALQEKIEKLKNGLEKFKSHPHVKEIRQMGFMVGIELVDDKEKNIPYDWELKKGIQVIQEARKNGLILRPLGNVIILMPPLSLSMEEIDFLLDTTYKAIDRVTLPR